MSFFEEVESAIREYAVGGIRVARYRLALEESVGSQLGVESNRVGSPYAPLATSELSGGSFLVEWSDGLVSRGSLSRAPREALDEVLASAFEGRYEDPEEANFPEAADVPDVALFSEDAARVATGESPDAITAAIDTVARVRDRHGVELLDASASASRSRRRVVSSAGFRAETQSSSFGFSVGFDSLVWDGHADRAPIPVAEIEERTERTAADFEGLKRTAEDFDRRGCATVLHPRVAEEFLRTFLLSNLAGGAVANGRSRFTADDFRSGRPAFREDFSLSARPLVPMGIGSFTCTVEGVPARDVDFVREGRLATPVLGLKYARRLEMEPAPAPASIEGYALELGEGLSHDEALHGDRVLLVHAVLGLHTQDPVRGEYSVLAPQGVLFQAGECRGRVSVTLNGSFFADLVDPSLRPVSRSSR